MRKKWIKFGLIGLGALLIAILATIPILLFPLGASAVGAGEVFLSSRLTSDFEDFEFGSGSGLAEISYVGIHKGKVQVVIAMYLDKTDPNYDKTLVYVIDGTSEEFLAGYPGLVDGEGIPRNQKKYDEWVNSLPRIWQNNPYHNHILYFDADVTDEEIKAKIAESSNYFYNFYLYCWTNSKVFIEEWVKVPKAEGTMRAPFTKGSSDGASLVACQIKVDDITSRLDDFKTTKATASTSLNIGDKGTVDVGAAATGTRDGALTVNSWGSIKTLLEASNAANADGEVDTVETWLETVGGTVNLWAGMFYFVSGTTYTCRDSESLGNLNAGSKQTVTGLAINIETGDLIGISGKGSFYTTIVADSSGGTGGWFYNGECIDPSDSQSFTWYAGRQMSLYGTGTEAGCSPDISNTPSSKDFGTVATSSTPTTGLTHFTVTNNSGGAVTITIKAIDWTGGTGWTHSDTATPGADTAGLKAGLEGADYTIIVKKTAAYNTLKAGLADSGTQKWGLKLYSPTSFADGVEKTTTVTLTATCD